MAADQLQPAERNAGRGAVVAGQSPLALVPPQLALVIYGGPVGARLLGELGELRGAPEADVAIRPPAQDERSSLFEV